MKVTTTGKSEVKLERPYLCVSEGAIWLSEQDCDEGYVCLDPLDSGMEVGQYREQLSEMVLFEGKVTLSN